VGHPWLVRKDIPVIISVGRLVPPKDHATLLRAFELVVQQRSARIIIVGEGPERTALQRTIDTARIPVSLGGPLAFADRTTAFRDAHCFVFPTRWDGWGMAPVEALAGGLPVISTDQAMSAHDFLVNGSNGWIVPPTVEGIRNAMQSVIGDPGRLAAMGARARESVADYEPAVGADRLVMFCRNLVQASSKVTR
jgi:glycosyltransferase involved in cell wall biosynthesis